MFLGIKEVANFVITYKWLFIAIILLGFIVFEIIFISRNNKKKEKEEISRSDKIRNMVSVSVFASISIILYLTLKFSLPIFPDFLKINFSNLPIILGAFLLGRKNGIMIVIIRTIIVLPFSGTFFVGELADLIISISIVLIGTYLYNKNRTKKGAVISLIAISLTWMIIASLSNRFILIPAYIELMFGGQEEVFVSLLKVIPNITIENYKWKYIFFAALPFNAIISVSVCFITFVTYKKLSILFHKFD